MKRYSLLALLMAFVLTASAQVNRAKAEFFFGQNEDQVEAGIGDNASQLVVLDSIARDFNKVRIEDRYVIIHSYTSPDGSAETNELVASKRSAAVEKLFDSKLKTDAHVIYIPHYYEWKEIKTLIQADSQLPNKDQVLSLITTEEQQISLSNAVASGQLIQKIKAIDNGATYSYIVRNVFPKFHRVTLEVRYVNGVGYPEAAAQLPHVEVSDAIQVEKPVVEEPVVEEPVVEEPVVEEPIVEEPVVEEPTTVVEEPVVVEPVVPEEPVVIEQPVVTPEEPEVVPEEPVVVTPEEPEVVTPDEPVVIEPPVEVKPVQEPEVVQVPEMVETEQQTVLDVDKALQSDTLKINELEEVKEEVQRSEVSRSFWSEFAQHTALKTNLLYDVALVPNIGLEYAVTDRFSVSLDWMYAWWSRDTKHDYWRVYGGDVELRYWLGNKNGELLTGHHIGAYGGLLTYDVEWGGTGYMGEKWSYLFGLSYGYAMPLSRRLRLDFEIGLGYMGGEYYEYEPEGDKYFWQQTKNRKWFGPTRAEISLIWLLGHK